ncbi:hypothetical protein MG293_013092 [Ovis ammon polii]|uniref:Uncharacterized protein n=1 Tax=Ovis ammon polii TaxID=230172 RepID=A0AAD4Y6P9_OVIAM|nr:hypothetical protein MG293_013092 [Ovis ammon polii]
MKAVNAELTAIALCRVDVGVGGLRACTAAMSIPPSSPPSTGGATGSFRSRVGVFQFQAPSEYLFPLPGLTTDLLLAQHPQSQLPASQPIRQLQLPALPGCSLSSRPFSCTPVSIPSGFDGF